MSRLLAQQHRFAVLLPRLLDRAASIGYQVTIGEAYRPPETAALYARQGRGITQSLHCLKLAVDLQVFQDGRWLQNLDTYAPLGAFWKGLDPDAAWGGDFPRADLGHFSLQWDGRR